MTYYENATAMAFKLDRWSEERPLRNFELEALECEERTSALFLKKPSIFMRCISVLRARIPSEAPDLPDAVKRK